VWPKDAKFQILFPQKDYYSQIILHRDHEQLHTSLLLLFVCLSLGGPVDGSIVGDREWISWWKLLEKTLL
jgi:hypothetical protein